MEVGQLGIFGDTVYLLRGFPFLFIFFLLFLVFHELLFPFLILLPVKRNVHIQLIVTPSGTKRNLMLTNVENAHIEFDSKVIFISSDHCQVFSYTVNVVRTVTLTRVRQLDNSPRQPILPLHNSYRQTIAIPTDNTGSSQTVTSSSTSSNFKHIWKSQVLLHCSGDCSGSMIHRTLALM